MFSKIVRDTFISGAGEFIYIVAIYTVNLIISRFLGAEGIGIYAQAIAITSFVSLAALVGFDVGILRFLSLYLTKEDWGHARGLMSFAPKFIFLTSLVLAGVVFVTSDFIANTVLSEPQLTIALRVFAFTVPLVALRTVWLNGIQAFQRTDYRIYIGRVAVPLVSLGSIALFLYLGWGWYSVLIGTVLTASVGGLLAYYVCRGLQKSIPGTEEEKPQLAVKEWLLFCYPLFISQLLILASPRMTILMLGFFHDSAEVGIFEIASKVGLLILIPLDISSFILAPMIGQMYVQGDMLRLQRLFGTVTKWILALSILIFLVMIFLAEPILAVFGREFVAGVSALYILAFGHLVNVSTGASGWMLIMSGHPKIHMFNSALSVLLIIALSLLLIPSYGVIGAAIVVALVEITINVARLGAVIFVLRIHPYRWDWIKPGVAGMATLIVAYLLHNEIAQWPISALWTSIITAASILIFYATFLCLSHWPQIKASYPLLYDNLRRV